MQLPKRKDVPVELTWDLSAIYNSEDAMQIEIELSVKTREHLRNIGHSSKGSSELCLNYMGPERHLQQRGRHAGGPGEGPEAGG